MHTPRNIALFTLIATLLATSGCSSYKVGSSVPEELRSIAVPVFENASGLPEIDAIVTQYVLREFQREGTMRITVKENASLMLLGTLTESSPEALNYDRNYISRASEYRYKLTAEITLVERATGKLLIDNLPVTANTTFLTQGDMLTGLQNAYPRIAKELARAIVDAVLARWPPATIK